MMMIVEYIPHVVAFVIIFVVGFILIDAFIDFLNRYYSKRMSSSSHQSWSCFGSFCIL